MSLSYHRGTRTQSLVIDVGLRFVVLGIYCLVRFAFGLGAWADVAVLIRLFSM